MISNFLNFFLKKDYVYLGCFHNISASIELHGANNLLGFAFYIFENKKFENSVSITISNKELNLLFKEVIPPKKIIDGSYSYINLDLTDKISKTSIFKIEIKKKYPFSRIAIGLNDKEKIKHSVISFFGFNSKIIKPLNIINCENNKQINFIKDLKKIKILTHRWHIPHQYELYKNNYEYDLIVGTKDPISNFWDYNLRPLPFNSRFIHIDDVNINNYDLALIHFDENILNDDKKFKNFSNHFWGSSAKFLLSLDNINKLAICHGTPPFKGQYNNEHGITETLVEEDLNEKQKIVNLFKNIKVILNSHQAEYEWGFNKSTTIWHGFDSKEFIFKKHPNKFLLTYNPNNMNRAIYRGLDPLIKGVNFFEKEKIKYTFLTNDKKVMFKDYQLYSKTKFLNYINILCNHKIFFNTTLRSPMPRIRGECMMTGAIPITLNNHDVNIFIDNEVDGFYSNSVDELLDFISFLSNNTSYLDKMRFKTRKKAQKVFSLQRYLHDWKRILNNI